MKARAILLASVLLVGCQASKNDGTVQQHAQSLSAASQGEASKFTSRARWLDDGTFYAQDQDLWTSIGDELKMGIPENVRIREQKQKYLRNKSYLHDVTLRAEPYMYIVASTTAALNMMQRLNKMFDGDWLLTVAAYNSGEGRVMKAIKANKSRGKPTDFWSLSLPQETKIYVPKMLALSDILKNSKRYGVRLPTADESRALARVRLDSPVEISQLADMAGMPVSKLKTFNAGVKGSTLGANGPNYVLVPQKHAAQLRESLASGDIAAVQPTQLADNRPLTSRSYQVRSGDTLSGIASRLGVSAKDLQQWNGIRGSGLKVGQNLVIGAGSSAERLANNSDSITYRVRKGDSLSSIAKRHGVNIRDVMRWNSDTGNLKPGDQLTLYVKNSDRPES